MQVAHPTEECGDRLRSVTEYEFFPASRQDRHHPCEPSAATLRPLPCLDRRALLIARTTPNMPIREKMYSSRPIIPIQANCSHVGTVGAKEAITPRPRTRPQFRVTLTAPRRGELP